MENNDMELDLKDIFYVIRKRIWFVTLITCLAIISSGIVSSLFISPTYSSTTTVMVGKAWEEGTNLQRSDLDLNRRLAESYGQVVNSRSVTEEVISRLNLELTSIQLQDKLTVNQVRDTEFIKIEAKNNDPMKAALIANTVAEVFMEQVQVIMNVDNVQILDEAIAPDNPVSPRVRLNMAIAAILGLMASVFIVFLLEYLDNTIKSEKDVQRHLELEVIGTVPYYDQEG
ncbi:Wzz/FepE/Etk N-terminal domain-containing protein [Proteinivorax tanatarense]|uniref:Wzz/FepE/Etk N-terminal domain-containing protein n=1 Tax=Proteinivorax tanatarense TaxID=1260629 RepID=A0AAU7VQ99_9FIRM